MPTEDSLATLIAMQQQATRAPSATPWPSSTPTPLPSDTVTPSMTPTATPTEAPTQPQPSVTVAPTDTVEPSATPYPTNTPRPLPTTPAPTAVAGILFAETHEIQDHYWVGRPFPRDSSNAVRDYASRSYSYGSTGGGGLQTHYGIDIQNPQGTDILAVAGGWVIYGGSDEEVQFGPRPNFYGNLVVIEHDFVASDGRPVYTLYGHMSQVDVTAGQRVEQSEKIGEVGATGVALGAHLHLEVRLGDPYSYDNTYNPDLWVRPWPQYGTLAGRVTDRNGKLLYDQTVVIQRTGDPDRTAYSYADDGVNGDPYYGENFTYGDLPAGEYQVIVRVRGVLRFKGTVTIENGKTSWIDVILS